MVKVPQQFVTNTIYDRAGVRGRDCCRIKIIIIPEMVSLCGTNYLYCEVRDSRRVPVRVDITHIVMGTGFFTSS